MRRLADEGMTMVIVTHEMHFAEDVADRVDLHGRRTHRRRRAAKKVLRAPEHERTKRFLCAVLDR